METMTVNRLTRIVKFVHSVLSQCEKPVSDVNWLKRVARMHGLRIGECRNCTLRKRLYSSDIYFVLETLDLLIEIQKKNCGKRIFT